MKIKPFIFVFFFCALILLSIVAIEPSKYGKETGATEESNTKIGVKRDVGWGGGAHSKNQGGKHGDGYWGAWTEKRGIVGEGENGREDEAENRGLRGDGEGGIEGGWGDGENGQSGGGGQGGGGQVGVGQKGKT